MLNIKLDLSRITASQRAYRQQETMTGAHFARRVMAMRTALEHMIRRFQQRQQKALQRREPVLEDGNQSTIINNVLNPTGAAAWPKRAAAILHGLHLPVASLLPDLPCCNEGPNWSTCDDQTYLTQLNDGPPQARQLGDTTSLALYIAPLNTIRIVWIGAEDDLADAKNDLMAETSNWTDWAVISREYADWLDDACQTHSP